MPSTEGLVKGFLQQHLNQVTERKRIGADREVSSDFSYMRNGTRPIIRLKPLSYSRYHTVFCDSVKQPLRCETQHLQSLNLTLYHITIDYRSSKSELALSEKPTMMPYSGLPTRLKGPSPPKFSS